MSSLPLLGWTALLSAILWTFYLWICLLRNYLVARKVGVPLRVIPVSHGNPFWMLVDRKIVSLCKRLPFGDNNFTRYNWRGWEVEDRYRSHLEMGEVWMQVTSDKNWLYLCDPDALLEIFKRRADFPRPLELYQLLNVFGPNLSTVDGQQWKRQRKITTTCFNEQANEVVWKESVSQAIDMLLYWASRTSIKSTAEDTRTLSLHVLSMAGFGNSFKFQGHEEQSAVNPATSYKESLKLVLDNCILIMALGEKSLAKPWLPARLRKVHEASVAFQKHMTDTYEAEKSAFADGRSTGRANLLTSLIKASHEEAKTAVGLTEREIYGNMFVFNFAGHDTTAHTLTFAVYFLAANPNVQDWLSEEIRYVLGSRAPHEWNYNNHFPRLKRCLAVLMETVRLYTPVPVAKWTDNRAQTLTVGSKTITIPPNTMVIPSYAAIHTHPKYWGPDSLTWRPSRWILNGSSGSFEAEKVLEPQHGTFIAWSEGERSCPGKKFSQVEFVATMAALFLNWRVAPVVNKGETIEDARRRVLEMVETDSAQVLLLQMLHPERTPLVWEKQTV